MAEDDSDVFTEVSRQGWGSRIVGAIGGMAVGLVLFLAAFPLLMWNESRAVDTARALAEGRAAVTAVESRAVLPANEGRLVYLSGQLETPENLAPPAILPERALKLRREVEMYQWQEQEESTTEKELGGGTRTVTKYTYRKVWSSSLYDSRDFRRADGHRNPGAKPLADSESQVRTASVGAFRLGDEVIGQLSSWRGAGPQALAALAQRDMRGNAVVEGDWAYFGDPQQPKIGDIRIGYSYVPLSEASIVARQSGNALTAYTTSNGQELVMAAAGLVSADRLFKAEEETNALITWALRLGGTVLMLIGILLVLRPITVLADVVPFIGDLLGAGAFLVALPLALCLSLATIAVAWIAVRPLLAWPLLGVAAILLVVPLLRRRRSEVKPAA